MANDDMKIKQTNALATAIEKPEIGAQVGVRRNEWFSQGGRTLKMSRNAYVGYRTVFDRDSGLILEGDK
ncbi:MAG: hypothetical protein ABJA50_11565 [Chloroflexota bacterium]